MCGPNEREFYEDNNGNVTRQSVAEAINRMGASQRPTDWPSDMRFLTREQQDMLNEHVRRCPY